MKNTFRKLYNPLETLWKPLENTFELSASNTIEQNAILWAEHYNNLIQAGQGLFLDFEQCPELEKPAIDCLVNSYGWTLEKPFFIRKSKN